MIFALTRRVRTDTPRVESVWLDVRKWTGLRGTFHPFIEVDCQVPEPRPVSGDEWQEWATAQLHAVASRERWQAGRYAYTAERRDEDGRSFEELTRGQWDFRT
ncbi:hypothetical protein BJF78_04770 [Pseudonocardia sp. CNS-139]|nr:hypothetical protein BJF78_04770 [Pseudonocardia sp. CNS-139]